MFHLFVNGKLGWYKKNDATINFGTYEGEIYKGKPNGIGTNTYQYDLGKYEGQWKNGEMHGQGTHYKFGRISKGEFKKNNPWNTIFSNNKGEIIGKYVSGKYIGE